MPRYFKKNNHMHVIYIFYYYSSAYVYRIKHNNVTGSTSGRLQSTCDVPYLMHISWISHLLPLLQLLLTINIISVYFFLSLY